MLLSIIALCSFALSSCGNNDEPKGDDLGDGLKTGFYASPAMGGYDCNKYNHDGQRHYLGELRGVIKIIDKSTLIKYTYSSSWGVAANNSCGNSKGSIKIDGKAWYYNNSEICSYVKNGNKIIVPNWDYGVILNILSDGSLLIDGFDTDYAYHHVAE